VSGKKNIRSKFRKDVFVQGRRRFSPDDLYQLIGSSGEIAKTASEKL